MLCSVLYDQLLIRSAICSFSKSAPDIVRVSGACAEVRGYVDVPLQIAGIEIAHPLLVITSLAFTLLIVMDILQPHAGKLSLSHAAQLELSVGLCDVCLEKLTDPKPSIVALRPSRASSSRLYSPRKPQLSSNWTFRVHISNFDCRDRTAKFDDSYSRLFCLSRCLQTKHWYVSNCRCKPHWRADRVARRCSDRFCCCRTTCHYSYPNRCHNPRLSHESKLW